MIKSLIKLIHVYRSETDLNARTRSNNLLYLTVHGWCTYFILIQGKMLSLINLMGFSTLPAMEPRHQAAGSISCTPTIPPLFCFHQHSIISSLNYSPPFSNVLTVLFSGSFIFSLSQKPYLCPESVMDLNTVHIHKPFPSHPR